MFNANVKGFDVGIWILLKHVTYFIKNLKYFQKLVNFFIWEWAEEFENFISFLYKKWCLHPFSGS